MLTVTDRKRRPMNALQQLIADFLADNPGETYASIGRRGSTLEHPFPKSTVYALATTPRRVQTNQPGTLAALARGIRMPESVVKAAAASAAGYEPALLSEEVDETSHMIMLGVSKMPPERREDVARRVRFILAEMEEERQANGH